MIDLATLGLAIASSRKGKKLRQSELAELSGLHANTITALENGRGDIGFSKLSRVLAVLGLELELRPAATERPTLDDLLKEDGDD